MIQEKCMECGQLAVLAKHVRKHGLTAEQYYRKWLMKPDEGHCLTCGKPTRFCGLTLKCFQPYCSNKCHNSNSDFLTARSEARRNKTDEEKAEIRAKQISTWEQTMGHNWKTIMAHRGFETYKEKTGYDTPWKNPEVKAKCRQAWNGNTSPACLDAVKNKISESIQQFFNNTVEERLNKRLTRLRSHCVDFIRLENQWAIYKCPVCGDETKIGGKALGTAIRLNTFSHLCSTCHCMNGISFKEKSMIDFIKTFGFEILENDRTFLNGKELDVFLPSLNLAFEFDGTYWHADSRFHDANEIMRHNSDGTNVTAAMIWQYDAEKISLCAAKNVTLYRIKEYDWVNDEINIKHFISEVIKNAKCKYK